MIRNGREVTRKVEKVELKRKSVTRTEKDNEMVRWGGRAEIEENRKRWVKIKRTGYRVDREYSYNMSK